MPSPAMKKRIDQIEQAMNADNVTDPYMVFTWRCDGIEHSRTVYDMHRRRMVFDSAAIDPDPSQIPQHYSDMMHAAYRAGAITAEHLRRALRAANLPCDDVLIDSINPPIMHTVPLVFGHAQP